MPIGSAAFTVLTWGAVVVVLAVFAYVAYAVIADATRSEAR